MNRRSKYWPAAFLYIAVLVGCTQESPGEGVGEAVVAAELTVVTVNYPLAYFAERILGDAGRVSFPAPADVDPAYWSPEPDVISEYQQADLIILNGAGYARWAANATLPRSRFVDTTAALSDQLIPIENTVTHTHGPTGDHSHGDTAFTTWLDLDIAVAQAQAITEAMILARPELEPAVRQGFADLEDDLRAMDAELKEVTAVIGNQPVVFSHPVYQYFERRYNLNGFSVHWEPDEVPEDAQWRQLESLLKQHPAKLIIWENVPLDETRRQLSELGVESVVFSPGGNRPPDGDWLSLMHKGITELRQ